MKIKNVMIFGDSYSTFNGYIPEGYRTYYSEEWRNETDVRKVEETWWKQFLSATGASLTQNNSWSGSTIGYTGYNNEDTSKTSSFIFRFRKLLAEGFFEKNPVDTVFVFGGTNDSWSNAPLGEMKYSDWTEQDLYNVLPAICYFAHEVTKHLPNADVVFLVNTTIKEEVRSALQKAAEYYGASAIVLRDIRKACGHPTVSGMKDIYEQTLAWFKNER